MKTKRIAVIGTYQGDYKAFADAQPEHVETDFYKDLNINGFLPPNEIVLLDSARILGPVVLGAIKAQLVKRLIPDLTEPIHSLSVKQPFASLLMNGKSFEIRSQPTKIRGLVLICSSKQPYDFKQLMKISSADAIRKMRENLGIQSLLRNRIAGSLHCGYAIGLGYLSDCRLMSAYDEKEAFVMHEPDPENGKQYVWEFLWTKPIEPFTVVGNLGLRFINEETKNKIKFI